ncbi:MAG: histidinol dehydrogenase, partial [Verrucomicrobia bacterium]|nr:histidinol dehydrogenase [Verrucomicrobiota bacterium]
MKIASYKDPGFAAVAARMKRRAVPTVELRDTVASIIADVASAGDTALVAYTKRFDGIELSPKNLFVTRKELTASHKAVTGATR